MLMLIIQPCYSSLDNQAYFNTSHVNVNHLKKVTFTVVKVYFNTSHVNVNPVAPKFTIPVITFQYISC